MVGHIIATRIEEETKRKEQQGRIQTDKGKDMEEPGDSYLKSAGKK